MTQKNFEKNISQQKIFFSIFFLANLFLASSFFGCSKDSKKSSSKIKVLTTIGQLQDAVKNIAKNEVIVESICQTGVNPHSYVITPKNIKQLAKADVIYSIGFHLEAQMQHVFKKMDKAVAIGEKAIFKNQLIAASAEMKGMSYDPHLWGSVLLVF